MKLQLRDFVRLIYNFLRFRIFGSKFGWITILLVFGAPTLFVIQWTYKDRDYLVFTVPVEFTTMMEEERISTFLGIYTEACDNFTNTVHITKNDLPICPCVPETLVGYKSPPTCELPMHRLELMYPEINSGGSWKPSDCTPRQRVAIVIPYRDREEHLRIFLAYMHTFLQRQLLEYRIFIIEQGLPTIFNRAALMNIGYLEASKAGNFDCIIFHDVDLLPNDDRNFYTCMFSPTHIGAYMNKFDYKMPYDKFFGGAIALTPSQMQLINGFSNKYWGWGGEDDDTYNRILIKNLTINRYPVDVGKTSMISHKKDKGNPDNPKRDKGYLVDANIYLKDGLNSVKYNQKSLDLNKLYTRVWVDIEREYDKMCIVNTSLPVTSPDNYLECLFNDVTFKEGTHGCCRDRKGKLYCCDIDPSHELERQRRMEKFNNNVYKLVVLFVSLVVLWTVCITLWAKRRNQAYIRSKGVKNNII